MDYKGSDNLQRAASESPFFTAGSGNLSPNENPDARNSLDTSAWAPDRDQRNIGQRTIDAESQPVAPEEAESVVRPLEMPPGYEGVIGTEAGPSAAPNLPQIDFGDVRVDGERVSRGTIAKAKAAIASLKSTGNAADFYNSIRGADGMTEANLKNSFNRVIGEA